MHNRLTRTHAHIRRRKSQCVCVCVCVFGYRTCHSVNRNLEMQADRARPSPSPRPRPRPNRNSSPKMRFYHASATIINDTRRVASCFILSRRVASPAFFAKIANNGNYQRDRQTDQTRPDLWLLKMAACSMIISRLSTYLPNWTEHYTNTTLISSLL